MDSTDGRMSRRSFLSRSGRVALAAPILSAAAAPERKVRMGVVGGGFGASFQWHEHPNAIVAAVSDLRADRRRHLMDVYRCEKAYNSLEELIRDDAIDAVAVFTGAPDHVRHAVAVMEAGKHCISAVPAALTLDECRTLKETKERTGRKYMMAETSYYRDHTIAARDLYAAGLFGEIFASEVEYYHPLTPEERHGFYFFEGKRTWRYGYPPMLYPTHSTGFLVGVTRERLTEVSCLGWLNPALKEFYPDNAYRNPFNAASALCKTDRGHICRCNVIFEGTEYGERAEWFGTELSYFMPSSSDQPFRIRGRAAPNWSEVPSFFDRLPAPLRHGSGHGGSHPFITHEFVSAVIEDREPAIDVYEALAMTAPGIVAHESSLKGGVQLRVPSFDRPKA